MNLFDYLQTVLDRVTKSSTTKTKKNNKNRDTAKQKFFLTVKIQPFNYIWKPFNRQNMRSARATSFSCLYVQMNERVQKKQMCHPNTWKPQHSYHLVANIVSRDVIAKNSETILRMQLARLEMLFLFFFSYFLILSVESYFVRAVSSAIRQG